jgi:methanogenic corrinoid protein MtbC1
VTAGIRAEPEDAFDVHEVWGGSWALDQQGEPEPRGCADDPGERQAGRFPAVPQREHDQDAHRDNCVHLGRKADPAHAVQDATERLGYPCLDRLLDRWIEREERLCVRRRGEEHQSNHAENGVSPEDSSAELDRLVRFGHNSEGARPMPAAEPSTCGNVQGLHSYGTLLPRCVRTVPSNADLTSAADTPLYNTAAVVQRTGVPATTIRAWERRYGYPSPLRDAGGQRMYSERDIVGIRWLSEQTALGVAISRAVAMLRGGFATPEPATPTAAQGPRSFAVLRAELMRALLEFDDTGAQRVLEEAFALFSVEDVCLQVVEPLLVEVGDRWHAGELSVADEHHVSVFVRARLSALLSAYQRPENRGPLVFTTSAPGEWHDLGILLVSVFLARRGVAVRYLGPNLPLEALAQVTAHHRASVVVVSAQSRDTADKLRDAARIFTAAAPPHPRLVFGGQAFNDDPALRESMDGTYAGADAIAAATTVVELLERSEERRRG